MIGENRHPSKVTAWLRLAAGVAVLLGLFSFLTQGYALAGPAGDIFRQNLGSGIDATPIFYTEVEHSLTYDYAQLFIE